jgi:hypothetical protein
MTAAERVLVILTWADALLALPLGLLLLGRAIRYENHIPRLAYDTAIWVGLSFSLAWWASFCLAFFAAYPGGTWAFKTYILLPPSVLGAETGVLGFIQLNRAWGIISLVLGVACGLLAVEVLSLVLGPHLR